MPTVQQVFDNAKKLLKNESYCKCVECINELEHLKQLCEKGNKIFPNIGNSMNELDKLIQEKMVVERRLESQKLKVQQGEKNLKSFNSSMEFSKNPVLWIVLGSCILFTIIVAKGWGGWGFLAGLFSAFVISPIVLLITGFTLDTIKQSSRESIDSNLGKEKSILIGMESELSKVERDISSSQSNIERFSNELKSLSIRHSSSQLTQSSSRDSRGFHQI